MLAYSVDIKVKVLSLALVFTAKHRQIFLGFIVHTSKPQNLFLVLS